MESTKTKNEDILSLMLNFFNKEKLEIRLKENVKKCYQIEFFFNTYHGPGRAPAPAKNIVNFSRKGEIYWVLEFKVAPNQAFNLKDLANETKSIYSKDWETSSDSSHVIGGLRRCIYTCLIKEVFEDFMNETLQFFRNADNTIDKHNHYLTPGQK